MATPQTEVESQAIELATEAFKTFCEDITGMFGVETDCEQKEGRIETVEYLKRKFKKLVAVNVVQAEGSIGGTFQLIFDQEGLFTLGGIIVMLPEKTILTNRREASPQLAASMVDAVGEAGNLLVGSWDRVFREGLKGHGHFLQRLPAFIGKPWDEPQKKIGLAGGEEFVYVPYEMTIGSYPAFNCGVIFPKTVFTGGADAEQSTTPEQDPQDTQASSEESDAPQSSDGAQSEQKQPEAKTVRPIDEAAPREEAPQTELDGAIEDKTEPECVVSRGRRTKDQKGNKKRSKPKKRVAKKAQPNESDAKEIRQDTNAEVKSDSQQTSETETTNDRESQPAKPETIADQAIEDDRTPSEEDEQPATGKISETIRKMTQSSPVLPGESTQPAMLKAPEGVPCGRAAFRTSSGLLSLCAADVMKSHVTWASPEESVQQALAKMQQHDTGYLTIGQDGVLEGFISKSDIAGALSPYLRSIFAKWRRPLDDATLKIKIKWIMSRPVRTVKPETPLATIMENVCRFGGCAFPVVDDQGNVEGLVTVFDIFQALLKTCADISTAGKAPQAPPLA